MRREVKYLYRRLLKKNGRVLDLKNIIGFYDEYNDLRGRALNNQEAPRELKYYLPAIKMPKYLQWAKQFLT